MALTFHHEIESRDGLTVRFTSTKIHPDAGVAWPWHHAVLAMALVQPMDTNPIATHFGDGLFEDDILREFHGEIYAEVTQEPRGKKAWVTTVRFTDAKWIPTAIARGFAWDSSA